MEDVLLRFREAGLLVAPDALVFLRGRDDARELAELVLSDKTVFVVSRELLESLARREEDKKIPVPVEVLRNAGFKPSAAEINSDLRFLKDKDVSGRSNCTGKVDDFVGYFRDRFSRAETVLKTHLGKSSLVRIDSLSSYARGHEVRIIGIVSAKKMTSKGHMLFELESIDGVAKVLALKTDKEPEQTCFKNACSLLLDDVVAVDGKVSDPFVMASEIVWPDIPVASPKFAARDVSIAFLSDVHVGSKYFLGDNLAKMLSWLNGEAESTKELEVAGKIKYLVVAGDVVDGIGVYPRQEKELVVRDIYEQYKMFFELVDKIPDYIEVIVCPGNHDAVRRAEPQPMLPDEILKDFKKPNVHFAGNPSWAVVEGLRLLVYHGTSLDSVIAGLPGMSYAHPEKSMVELLKRRNLSPIYGENPIVPESKDYLAIDEVPDIVHMGHVHKNGYAKHKSALLVNSGTWQARTDFQVAQGHVPSPCILPVYEMRTGKLTQVDFSTGKTAG
ncbi:DNA-directed DNA polymerase II small subunit [Candidatus Micrarchaeota archaeon]|nr:DNA-directed DNA polymerase II small subunit [Candidatus Micrarchaeota archaeon]